MSTSANGPLSGADFIRQFLPTSPFVGHLGMQLTEMQPDMATLTLPFTEALVTIGKIVHGHIPRGGGTRRSHGYRSRASPWSQPGLCRC